MTTLGSVSTTTSSSFPPPSLLRHRHHHPPQTLTLKPKTKPFPPPIRASVSDPFVLEIAEKLEDSLLPTTSHLQKLRENSTESLLSKPWPTSKQEPFRFTDTSFLRRSQILPSPVPALDADLDCNPLPSSNSIVIVDGHFVQSLSQLSSLPDGVYAGGIGGVPVGVVLDRVLEVLGNEDGVRDDKDVFWDLNGVGAPDVVVVYVPEGVRIVDDPVYLRFWSNEGAEVGEEALPVSNPRVVVVVEKGAEVAIVEEHLGVGGSEEEGKCYWENSVVEIVIGAGAKVSHSYLQRQSRNAAHIKWTFARQDSSSTYELVEISSGARLSRHNLHIQQLGSDTVTNLSTFHISQNNQTQDLHSRLILDYPRGYSRQIHKCIVANSTGQAVFDGNIKVNRFAQQTDAGQLTRTLLLEPRATANVKPNLQIIADDVKCSHGAAISNLEADQLFYFQTRGIDLETARDALVFSFGAEVVAKLPFEPLRKDAVSYIKNLLTTRSSG